LKVINERVNPNTVTNFGTLEYVLDKYSNTWSWKITGERAVNMVSRLISQLWYGEGPDEAIIPDTAQNIQQIQWIHERYPMEILSKSTWRRKLSPKTLKKIKDKKN